MAVKTKIGVEELTEIASEFLRDNYDMEFAIPIIRNNRLKTTQGRYISSYKDVPLRIEIAGNVFEYGAESAIIGVLKHELVHYALDVKGEPNEDGHPHFEAELRKHGAPPTDTNVNGMYYEAMCESCGNKTYGRNKVVTYLTHRFESSCCNVAVKYVGERIYDGTEAIE